MEQLTIEYIEGISDPIEKRFGLLAIEQGLIVEEAPMITIEQSKEHKWDKNSTVCDFLVKKGLKDLGIFVELTIQNTGSRKARQKEVMRKAGLINRYVQLTEADLNFVDLYKLDLYEYMLLRIQEQNN